VAICQLRLIVLSGRITDLVQGLRDVRQAHKRKDPGAFSLALTTVGMSKSETHLVWIFLRSLVRSSSLTTRPGAT
jgi:hypothetical protein